MFYSCNTGGDKTFSIYHASICHASVALATTTRLRRIAGNRGIGCDQETLAESPILSMSWQALWLSFGSRREKADGSTCCQLGRRNVRLTTILRRAGSFPAADGDFNEHRSGTETRPCLTALVKVTIGVLNDQFIPKTARTVAASRHRIRESRNARCWSKKSAPRS